MIRRPPRATRTDTLFPLHDALPISTTSPAPVACGGRCPRAWTSSTRGGSSPRCTTRASPAITCRSRRRCTTALSRSEEHTSELQSLMRISYAVFCLKKKNENHLNSSTTNNQHQQNTTQLHTV